MFITVRTSSTGQKLLINTKDIKYVEARVTGMTRSGPHYNTVVVLRTDENLWVKESMEDIETMLNSEPQP